MDYWRKGAVNNHWTGLVDWIGVTLKLLWRRGQCKSLPLAACILVIGLDTNLREK